MARREPPSAALNFKLFLISSAIAAVESNTASMVLISHGGAANVALSANGQPVASLGAQLPIHILHSRVALDSIWMEEDHPIQKLQLYARICIIQQRCPLSLGMSTLFGPPQYHRQRQSTHNISATAPGADQLCCHSSLISPNWVLLLHLSSTFEVLLHSHTLSSTFGG